MQAMTAKTISFQIYFPGETGAGLRSFSDLITITVDSGDAGGDAGEFEQHMLLTLQEWYPGASVTLEEVKHG
jgi:hypothetical protein